MNDLDHSHLADTEFTVSSIWTSKKYMYAVIQQVVYIASS